MGSAGDTMLRWRLGATQASSAAQAGGRELIGDLDGTDLGHLLREGVCPAEVRQLGRTMRKWRTQIAAWHHGQVTNGPTETMNALQKRIKSIAFGMTNFVHWRIRVLLYAGKPNWSKLATVTP